MLCGGKLHGVVFALSFSLGFPLCRWRKEVKSPSPLSQEDIKVRGPYSQTKSGEDIIKSRREWGGGGGGAGGR